MARQRIYLNSLETLLEEKIRANVNYVNTLLNEMGMIFDRTTTLDSGFGFTTDDATGTAITDTTDHYLMANVSIDNLALLEMLRPETDAERLALAGQRRAHPL